MQRSIAPWFLRFIWTCAFKYGCEDFLTSRRCEPVIDATYAFGADGLQADALFWGLPCGKAGRAQLDSWLSQPWSLLPQFCCRCSCQAGQNSLWKLEDKISFSHASRTAINLCLLVAKGHLTFMQSLARHTQHRPVLEFNDDVAPWAMCWNPLPGHFYGSMESTNSITMIASALLRCPPLWFPARLQRRSQWMSRLLKNGWEVLDDKYVVPPSCLRMFAFCRS